MGCYRQWEIGQRQPSIMPYYSELEFSPYDTKPVTIQ